MSVDASSLVILAAAWSGYCALHSLLITPSLTRFLKTRMGYGYRFYRLIYNVLAVLLLLPLLAFTYSLRGEPLYRWEGMWVVVQWTMVGVSLYLFAAGARKYSMSSFLGLHQLRRQSTRNLINHSGKLDTTGILGVVRHPFYAAIFPLIWSRNADEATLVVNVVLTLYTIIGTRLEERKLIAEFGDEYRQYQKKVGMFFPKIRF